MLWQWDIHVYIYIHIYIYIYVRLQIYIHIQIHHYLIQRSPDRVLSFRQSMPSPVAKRQSMRGPRLHPQGHKAHVPSTDSVHPISSSDLQKGSVGSDHLKHK